MGILQNNEEKPSDYLNRLQVALSAVVRRGGITESERNRYLLKQFCRGCWNDALIADLQLERKMNALPSFAELVLLIRTEEDKQASKHNRMKKHLGLHKSNPAAPKLRVASQQLAACSCAIPEIEVTETEVLKRQLSEIQAQVAVLQTTTPHKVKANCPDTTEINTLKRQIADIQAQTHLSHHSLKSLDDLLDVELQIEGANGEAVPYLGYVELNLTFPEEFLGEETEVPTLVLVVPDVSSVPQILVGTNSLDVLNSNYVERHDCRPQSFLPGYSVVLNILEVRQRQASTGVLGLIKAHSKTPEVVPAGSTVVVEGQVHMSGAHQEKWAVVEAASSACPFWRIAGCSSLCTLPVKRSCSMSILLRNETQHDITIPPRTVLAEIHAVQQVMGKEPSADSTTPETKRMEFDFGDSPLSAEWKERITRLLNSTPEVFSQHDMDFGHTSKVKHHIKLSDNTPFKHRARPIHPHDVDAVKKHLQELLDSGVIRESESPFASPIVVLRKKDGSVRLCIDFRKLNLQTIKDAYALPNLEEVFSLLTGSKWFSVLDLKSGYYQVEMEEADKQKTAFVCPLGFWEFNRMPQGVTNAPSTFQRLMERCMGDLNRKEALVFIDDLIIFSDTLEQHEARRFVKDYSKITKPLNDLTAGYPPLRKHSQGREKPSLYFHPKAFFGERWTPECQRAFEEIIDKLTTAPVLGFANPKLPYVLHTDASTTGLGAVLYQEQDGQMRAVASSSSL
ncbi:Retrovirus-related Pol polyprotein from transposon opus Protease [Larimichthys crocea]|uniref:ribonuclease H n=1 Tax=Larimichthys crocea TaxID=215358 RepID=A0A6G0I6Z2_LARCR|nr:Retrovirus-related Pol polyprotein from transposon opus Protease [Larimichthys crocea]